jgi:hypothetical protein
MDDAPVRRIYVISPLGAPTKAEVQENIARAQRLCFLVMVEEGLDPFASHAFYTLFLDDSDPQEREMGRQAGLTWLECADEAWVFTKKGISGGMKEEIELAELLGIAVVKDPLCWKEVDG